VVLHSLAGSTSFLTSCIPLTYRHNDVFYQDVSPQLFFLVSPQRPYELLLRARLAPHPLPILPNENFHGNLTFADYCLNYCDQGQPRLLRHTPSWQTFQQKNLESILMMMSLCCPTPPRLPIQSFSNRHHHYYRRLRMNSFRFLRTSSTFQPSSHRLFCSFFTQDAGSIPLPPHTIGFLPGANSNLPRKVCR
jgi:hypothetical protein